MRDVHPKTLQHAVLAVTTVFFAASASATESLIIDSAGNIGNAPGIFSTAVGDGPTEAVDVQRTGTASRFQLTSFTDTASQAPQFIQRRSRGSASSAFPLQSFDNLGLFSFRGMRPNGGFTSSRAIIAAQTTESWSNSANGTRMLFGTTPNGTDSLITRLVIQNDGDITVNGAVVHSSSRSVKRDIEAVDPGAVLNRVLELPIASWRYDRINESDLHIGPMAEDFHAAFGLGSDARTLAASDVSGVALAAIQGLKAKHDRRLAEKEAEIASLQSTVATLRGKVAALEKQQAATSRLQGELAGLRELVHTLAANGRLAATH